MLRESSGVHQSCSHILTANARSATQVLAAVKSTMSKYKTQSVTLTGHSLGKPSHHPVFSGPRRTERWLGGAIAIIGSVYLKLNLSAGTNIRTIAYASPRVGNQAFVNLFNSLSEGVRINNKCDLVLISNKLHLSFG